MNDQDAGIRIELAGNSVTVPVAMTGEWIRLLTQENERLRNEKEYVSADLEWNKSRLKDAEKAKNDNWTLYINESNANRELRSRLRDAKKSKGATK